MKRTGLLFLLLSAILSSVAQEYITPVKNDLMPPTPQSWKPVEYQMPQPSMLTGAVDLSIPIYTITAGDYSLPIYMQYHSNGIKVTDDPGFYGYGWSLMPALRATRTIMGRPDEQFKFMSTPTSPEDGFSCIGNQFRFLSGTIPYDTQHDIFTFSIPGKNITAILDCTSGAPLFVTPVDEEYTIKSDASLYEIEVTDPYGVKYIFGGPYEVQPSYEYLSGALRTSWALKKIIINNGDVITLNWTTINNPMATKQYLGGFSFMDSFSPGLWAGVPETEFDNDDGMAANFRDLGVCPQILSLQSISFPNGTVSFSADKITVISGSVVKQVDFTFIRDNTLLKSLNISDEGIYNFDYNEVTVINPLSQDWWGFYNGKQNPSLTPKFKVKYIGNNEYKENTEEKSYGDRSPNAEAMKANILTKVTYPTGGYTQFDYEPHKFNATRTQEGWTQLAESCNPKLSMGGGIRVSKITTCSGEAGSTPVSVIYQYSQAVVEAVPSLATFFDIQDVALVSPDGNVPSTVDLVRSFHINIFSDYMRYDIGTTPVWYDTVTAVYPEGKIEYRHQDFVSKNHIIKDFGKKYISALNRVFSTGPQLVEKTTYKFESNKYTMVESESFSYKAVPGSRSMSGTQVLRNTISTGGSFSPDFNRGNEVENCKSSCILEFNPYDFKPYTINPYVERLIAKSKTVYTENGSVTTTENYTYKSNTSLIASVSRTTSDSGNSVVAVSYPSASGTAVEKSMIAANVVGKPVSETLTRGSATVKYTADYIANNGNFYVKQTSTAYGGSTDKLLSPVSTYHTFGRLSGSTDADGISAAWLWGYDGAYPVYKVDGYSYSELLTAEGSKIAGKNLQNTSLTSSKGLATKILYKNLVGPTSITAPSGIVNTYSYDSSNRLYEVRRGGTLLQRYQYNISHQYNISQTSENYVQSNDFITDTQAHTVVSYYDGLGRESRVEDKTTGIRTFNTYDGMGRLARVSVPQVDDPDSYAWTLNGYEASPRNMLVMKTMPGQLWHSQKKSSKTAIYTNTATGEFSCAHLAVDASGGISSPGKYAAGKLMIEQVTDEDGYITRTFTDLEGKVVMTAEGRNGKFLYTRNVYDDYGRLRYVLPPNMTATKYEATNTDLPLLAFIYKYDSRGRLVYTKTPGCAPEEIRYSPAGRVVARHTPSMASGKWILYFYDRYGREVIQALATLTSANLNTLSSKLFVAEYASGGSVAGYNIIGGFPASITPQKITYYDSYDFATGADADLLGTVPRIVYKGLVTGVRDYTATSSGLTTVNIYNASGFVTAVNSRMLNGRQMRTFTYDRRGKVLSEQEVFTHSNGKIYTRVTNNTYDNAERLISSTVVENGKTAKIERSYGKNGLLSLENFGNGLHRSYTYDIHGWLTKSQLASSLTSTLSQDANSKSEEYYQPLAVGGVIPPPSLNSVNLIEELLYTEGKNPLYSGCPSAKVMISGARYDYTFDNHRRLVKADYTASSPSSRTDYSTEYSYDDVANPLTVMRKGVINDTSLGLVYYGVLDDLTYSYNGNQVQHIQQAGTGVDFYGRTGYALESGDYTWNAAGLLNSDSSRGIVSTTYNHLGLPVSQVVPSGLTSITGQQPTKTVNYAYSADGVLLAINNSGVMRHYSGSRIFQNNALEYSYFPAATSTPRATRTTPTRTIRAPSSP